MNRRFEIIFNKLDYSRIRIHKFISSLTHITKYLIGRQWIKIFKRILLIYEINDFVPLNSNNIVIDKMDSLLYIFRINFHVYFIFNNLKKINVSY